MASGRGWCYTLQVDDEKPNVPKFDEKTMSYMVCQLEKAPTTGRLHWQGYVHYKRAMKLANVKRDYPRAHLEIALGSAQQNTEYCTKDETRVEGPYMYGSMPKQGKRTDAETFWQSLKSGVTDYALCDEFPGLFMRWHKGIDKMRLVLEEEEAKQYRPMTVHLFWGKTRTGKTRAAREMYPNSFLMHPISGQEWWDGYSGQREVVIDDYRCQWPLHRLLQVLDGHPLLLPIKGGFRWALFDTVVLTSNSHVTRWYQGVNVDQMERDALMARFTGEIVEYPIVKPAPMSPLILSPPALRPGNLTPHAMTDGAQNLIHLDRPSARILNLSRYLEEEEKENEPGWTRDWPLDLSSYLQDE